jgi:hypothetical protein
MIRASLKRRLAIMALSALCAAPAYAQTQEQVQERLVDTIRKAGQETSRAAEKFRANDAGGGCAELRAAVADTAAGLELARQLSGLINQDTALNENTRDRMLQDVLALSATLASQKQGLAAQIATGCS